MDTFLMVLPCYKKIENYIVYVIMNVSIFQTIYIIRGRINYIIICCTRAISLINVDLLKKKKKNCSFMIMYLTPESKNQLISNVLLYNVLQENNYRYLMEFHKINSFYFKLKPMISECNYIFVSISQFIIVVLLLQVPNYQVINISC